MTLSAAYFISDAHLGRSLPSCEDREKDLIEFLQGIRGDAGQLFILGDLFDFWIEYRYAIRSDYFNILHVLKLLVDGGTEIHYLAGNHDFALGPFLQDKIGIRIHMDHLSINLQGKRLYLGHGDGLLPGDAGYLLLRRIFRNPTNQRLFKLLHPGLGIPLAAFCSGFSRHYLDKKMVLKKKNQYRRWVADCLQKNNDIVILGHTHVPEFLKIDGKLYCNTGEWMRRYSFAVLKEGDLQLKYYVPGGKPEEIPPVDFP